MQNDFEPEPFDWEDVYTGELSDVQPPDPLILSLIEQLPPGRALDLGCGAGGLAIALAKRGWQVTGVDIAKKAIVAGKKAIQKAGVEAELFVADQRTWHPPQTYDLVTSTFALPGTKATRSNAFSIVDEALAPGGTVLIKDFDTGMAASGHFEGWDLVTVEELGSAFGHLDVVRLEVVDTPVHHHSPGDDPQPWTAALLHARKPMT